MAILCFYIKIYLRSNKHTVIVLFRELFCVCFVLLFFPFLVSGETYSYTFTAKQIGKTGVVDLGGVEWIFTGTTGKSWDYNETKGQQFGSRALPYRTMSLSTKKIAGVIESVIVNTSGSSGIEATFEVTVGGVRYGDVIDLTSTPTDYTFEGLSSGEIKISYTQPSTYAAIYIKSISVVYSEYKELNVGTIYAVNNKLTLNTLTIKSDRDQSGEVKVDAGSLKANQVIIEKIIDDKRWYFFSLPFDCRLEDVVAVDGNGKELEYAKDATSGDYVINEYDQERNVVTGKAWKELLGTGHTLNAGQGYIIGYFGEGDVVVQFPSVKAQIILPPDNKTLDYTDRWIIDGENSTKGFNLIGLPYYQKVNGELTPMLVTIPNADGKTYTQVEYGDVSITPFTSFFVQTSEAPVFTTQIEQHAAPSFFARGIVNKVVITFADDSGASDQTTIIDDVNSTIEYEIGCDLVKWIGYADIPQIYSIQGDDILAFNSVAIDNTIEIYLGVYAPTSGEYTFAFSKKSTGNLNEWELCDTETSAIISLTQAEYRVFLAKGEYKKRFKFRKKRQIPTDCNDGLEDVFMRIDNGRLQMNNVSIGAEVYVYDAIGRLVDMLTVNSNLLYYDFAVRGVYIVVVCNAMKTTILKIIY